MQGFVGGRDRGCGIVNGCNFPVAFMYVYVELLRPRQAHVEMECWMRAPFSTRSYVGVYYRTDRVSISTTLEHSGVMLLCFVSLDHALQCLQSRSGSGRVLTFSPLVPRVSPYLYVAHIHMLPNWSNNAILYSTVHTYQ